MDTAGFHSQEGWLEEGFWGTKTFVANGDDLSIGQFIGLLQGGGGSSGCHFLFEVKGNIAELFLDVTDNFTLTGGTSGSIEGEDSLDGNIHSWHVEGFEHDLGHL